VDSFAAVRLFAHVSVAQVVDSGVELARVHSGHVDIVSFCVVLESSFGMSSRV